MNKAIMKKISVAFILLFLFEVCNVLAKQVKKPFAWELAFTEESIQELYKYAGNFQAFMTDPNDFIIALTLREKALMCANDLEFVKDLFLIRQQLSPTRSKDTRDDVRMAITEALITANTSIFFVQPRWQEYINHIGKVLNGAKNPKLVVVGNEFKGRLVHIITKIMRQTEGTRKGH